MKIKEVLDRTAQIVLVDRQKEYNQTSKTEMHSRIAEAWSATLGRMVTAHEVALCMVQLKVIRAACQPGHEDSYIDAASAPSLGSTQTMSRDTVTTRLDEFGRNPNYKSELSEDEIERAIEEIRATIQKYSK